MDLLRASGRWIAGAALALALVSTAAFAADPFDVYVVLTMTGPNAFAGSDAHETLVAFQNVVNREGGIRGRPLNFVFQDSQGNPQTAVALTNEVLTKHPALIVGDTSVATCNAMAPLLKSGPVQFCLSPGFRPERDGYSYSVGLSAIEQAQVLFRNLRERGLTRVALVVATDATGRLAEPEFAATAALPENRAIALVTIEHFNPTDMNVAAQVARIRAANAQVVIAWVNGSPFGTVVRSMKDAGLSLPLYAGVGNLNYKELQTFGPWLPNDLYFCCVGPIPAAGQPLLNGPLKAAQTKYAETFRTLGIKPSYSHAGAWDTGLVVVAALRALGPDATPAQVRSFVNNLHDVAGIEAVFDFRSGDMRGLPISFARSLRWDQSKEAWFVASGPGGSLR